MNLPKTLKKLKDRLSAALKNYDPLTTNKYKMSEMNLITDWVFVVIKMYMLKCNYIYSPDVLNYILPP